MKRFHDIVIRAASVADNASKIAKLLYLTDPYIYPFLCADPADEIWVDFVSRALKDPDHVHSARNMLLAIKDGSVVGLICAYPLAAKKVFLQPVDRSVSAKYVAVWEGYYKHAEPSAGGLYISNLCVDPAFRGKGIGGALLHALLEQHPREDIALDVLADNLSAVSLYEKAGFTPRSRYNGFAGTAADAVQCISMLRPFAKNGGAASGS